MEYLYFTNSSEVENIQTSGIQIHDGLNYKEPGVFFVPNLALDHNGPNSEFAQNDFGLESKVYFWSLIYRKNNEPNGLGDSIVVFDLPDTNFPIMTYLSLKKKTAYSVSNKLENHQYAGIQYASRKSLKSILAGINQKDFVIETEFRICDADSLDEFIHLLVESGWKPWKANSFLLSTNKPIEPECIKQIIEFKKQE